MTYWIVTLRERGDDEDSLLIVQPEIDTTEAAVEMAVAQFCTQNDIDPEPDDDGEHGYYVNHVVRCGQERPTHEQSAPC